MRPSRSRPGRIDVESSINSGQVFLWERDGDIWYGIDGGSALSVDASGAAPQICAHAGAAPDIFRQGDDMRRIIAEISRDRAVARAVGRFPGMRLMRQDPFQCLITFIASANSNIPRIKGTLGRLCSRYGGRAELDGRGFALFPAPARLARASPAGLRSCGLGYRAKYVRQAAAMVSSGRLDLESLARAPYDEAMEALLEIPGVGGKVADCVMLFSLEKLDAFPLDRWMSRILEEGYPGEGFGSMTGITPKRYAELHARIAARFGPYAGYAQQFLFKAGRQDARGLWAVNP